MTNLIVQPLLALLGLIIGGVVVGAIAARVGKRSLRRLALTVAGLSLLLLTALSTPAIGLLLRNSLALSTNESISPDYVVVLSGGYYVGTSPDLDTLSADTTQRVVTGVRYWKQHPSARMVMTGAVSKTRRGLGRITELMADAANCRGVPASAILRETAARTTREHPVRLLQMSGIGPGSTLTVVTARSHERRAVIEFRRYFAHVMAEPVPEMTSVRLDSWFDWVPQNEGLLASTTAIREWIGIGWYRLLALRAGRAASTR